MSFANSRTPTTAAPSRLASDVSATTSSYDNVPLPPPDPTDASLILRPANFGGSEQPVAPPLLVLSSHTRKRRELIELAGNPFVPESHTSSPSDGQTAAHFRQVIYPAYDASGRRIGLDHLRNPSASFGYYREHVHEYGTPRNAGAGAGSSRPSQQPFHPQHFRPDPLISQRQTSPQLPLPRSSLPPSYPLQSSPPPQATVHWASRYQGHGPLPPVSAVIAGISPDSHFNIGSFSHIQNRPRTPHEILGLPQDAPLNLWSLADPETPDAKPQYNYHVLVKLAILGNKDQKATLQDILRAIRLRFPYYAKLPKQEAVAFGNSIRHLLSLLAAFVREPKPVTEPGKGSYWRVDFSNGEGNKRARKRNKPQKKANDVRSLDNDNGKQQGKQPDKEKQESRSDSGDSEQSASPSTETLITSESQYARYPDSMWLPPPPPPIIPGPIGKGGRKPAPKNLTTTTNGETITVPTDQLTQAPNEYYRHIDSEPPASVTSRSQPFLQLRPDNVGAHRDHMARGTARAIPYPPSRVAIPNGRTSSDPESISSERPCNQSNVNLENNRRENSQDLSMRLTNGEHAILQQQYNSPDQRDVVIPTHSTHNGYAYNRHNQHYSLSKNGASARYDSISPLESPASNQSNLSPDPNHFLNPNGIGSHSHADRTNHTVSLSDNPSLSSRMPHKTAVAASALDEFLRRSRASVFDHHRSPLSSSSSSSGPSVGSLVAGTISSSISIPNPCSSAPDSNGGHRQSGKHFDASKLLR